MARKLSVRQFKKHQAKLAKQAVIAGTYVANGDVKMSSHRNIPIVKVEKLDMRRMTVKQWIAVPNNPAQDPERAKRPNNWHLRKYHPELAKVMMAEYPDGSTCKINGHSRCYMWAEGKVDFIPEMLNVEVVQVTDRIDAMSKLGIEDSSEAVKQAPDNVYLGFRLNDVPAESTFFKSGRNFATPLQYAFRHLSLDARQAAADKYGLVRIAESNGSKRSRNKADVGTHIAALRPQLISLDAFATKYLTSKPSAPLITSYLMAHLKYGEKIVNFYERVVSKAGVKIGTKSDAVNMVWDLIQKAPKTHKNVHVNNSPLSGAITLGAQAAHILVVEKILGALEKFMEGPFERPDYVPKVNMIHNTAVELNTYLLPGKPKKKTGAGDVLKRPKQ